MWTIYWSFSSLARSSSVYTVWMMQALHTPFTHHFATITCCIEEELTRIQYTFFSSSNHLSPHHSQRIKQARKLSKYIVHTCTVVKKKKTPERRPKKGRKMGWDKRRREGGYLVQRKGLVPGKRNSAHHHSWSLTTGYSNVKDQNDKNIMTVPERKKNAPQLQKVLQHLHTQKLAQGQMCRHGVSTEILDSCIQWSIWIKNNKNAQTHKKDEHENEQVGVAKYLCVLYISHVLVNIQNYLSSLFLFFTQTHSFPPHPSLCEKKKKKAHPDTKWTCWPVHSQSQWSS